MKKHSKTLDMKLIELFESYGYTVKVYQFHKNKWTIELLDVDKEKNMSKIIHEHFYIPTYGSRVVPE